MELHPLEVQRKSVYNWRQIGLGTLGLGDMLIKLGVTYGSIRSLQIIDEVFKTIARTSVETSLELAKTEGCYPMCNKNALVNSSFIQALELPQVVLQEIETYGLFNSQLLTCAPTGSIGTMLECSTGIEPNFAFSFNRRTISLNKEETIYNIDAKIVQQYKETTKQSELPNYFVSSEQINYIDRIKVQSVLQRWIDASISSTINLPEETTIEQVYDIYLSAWEYGLKGVTIYRNNCQRQSILSTDNKLETNVTYSSESNIVLDSINTISRNDLGHVLSGETYKHKTACGTLYITVNKDSEGNIVEIFTNSSKNGTCKANLNGETRLASLALRAGVKTEEVIDTLKSIQCQSCTFAKAKGNQIDGMSCPDIISKCLKQSYNNKRIIPVMGIQLEADHSNKCPECGQELVHSGGCVQCRCGYSKCN